MSLWPNKGEVDLRPPLGRPTSGSPRCTRPTRRYRNRPRPRYDSARYRSACRTPASHELRVSSNTIHASHGFWRRLAPRNAAMERCVRQVTQDSTARPVCRRQDRRGAVNAQQRVAATGAPSPRRGSRRHRLGGRVVATTVVTAITVAGVAFAGGQAPARRARRSPSRSAASSTAAWRTSPIQQLADVKDARALAPGTQSQQNPLDVTVLSKLELDLDERAEAAAAARHQARRRQPGRRRAQRRLLLRRVRRGPQLRRCLVGGNDNAFPANATIDLSATGIAGNSRAATRRWSHLALGGVKVTIGAVAALAQTPVGCRQAGLDQLRRSAGLNIVARLAAARVAARQRRQGAQHPADQAQPGCLQACAELPRAEPGRSPDLSLENGAITLSASTRRSDHRPRDLLQRSNLNLNHLPANTDLIDLLINYLSSPSGLSAALNTS